MKKRNRPHIVFTSLLIIGGFVLTSLVSYLVSLSSLRHQIQRSSLPLTSDTIYSEIQRDLLRPIFISSLMAHDTFLRDWTLRGEKDPDEITRYLGEIRKRYASETTFFVSDKTGAYYYPGGILKHVSPEEPRDTWYYRVREMYSDYEINVDVDMAHQDTLTIFINYKVYDYENNFIGATGVGLAVRSVTEMMANYKERYNRDICFFDKEGNITLGRARFLDQGTNVRENPCLDALFEDLTTQAEKTFHYRHCGDMHHASVRYIPEFQWYLLVEQGEAAEKREIFMALLINLGACLVLSLVLIFSIRAIVGAYERELETMAVTDKLTGLYNRHACQLFFTQFTGEYQRNRTPFCVFMADLDNFKGVNDRYGHIQGDQVLRETARVLSEHTRGMDVASRWGGEEFLVLLKDCTLEDAFERGEMLRKEMETRVLELPGGTVLSVTFSFGVAEYREGETPEETVDRADRALYEAKRKGKNRGEKG